jgi:tRNA1(Val) A37 N6-methylase TrmN6
VYKRLKIRLLKLDYKKMKGEKDVLSEVFEKSTSLEDRSKHGQYFTHTELVNLILDSIPLKPSDIILDPTCGAGAFLKECLRRNKKEIKNIYGADIDEKALNLCKLNLLQKMDNPNLIRGDFISQDLFKESFFDVIVGNPPFKHLTTKEYPSKNFLYKNVVSGIANSATLVLIKSFELLKEGGYLGFVLPKNFLRVRSFNKIRNFLLANSRIISLFDVDHHFKDVRCDQIILIVQKQKLNQNDLERNLVKIFPYEKGTSLKNQKSYTIPQKEFFNYTFFPLFYNLKIKTIADKLLNIKSILEDNSEIFRGLSISSSHPAISPSPEQGLIKGYRGDSILRFGTKYFIYMDSSKIPNTEKNKLKRLSVDKIIVQNISSKEGGLFVNFSKKNEFTLDTVTNIIPNKGLDLYFLLGLIGSKLANFFMTNVVYLNSNFTMHTDKSYLGKFPIIASISKKLLEIKDKYSEDFFREYDILNKLIFRLYNITNNEIEIINNILIKTMSKKQNDRTNE